MENRPTNFPAFFQRFYGRFKWDMLWMFFFFSFQHMYVWVSPILVGLLVDLVDAEQGERMFRLMLYSGILLGLIAINMPAALMRVRFQSIITRAVSHDLRYSICRQLQQLTLLYHDKNSIGRLQSKAIRDIEVLEQIPRHAIYMGFGTVINIFVAIVVILLRSPLALLFFIILVPLSVIVRRYFGRKLQESTRHYRETFEDMSAGFYDMMTMIPVTRAHSLEDHELSRVSTKLESVFKKGRAFDFVVELFNASGWVSFTLTQTLFLIGSVYFCFGGYITVGDVVMFNTFFATISGSVVSIMSFVPILSQARDSSESIMELLNAPELEINAGKQILQQVRGGLVFENVSFYYPDKKQHAIRNFTLTINAGESVAFVGPSGVGKSTLLSLILGFIHPGSGRILIDGFDMKTLDLRSCRQFIGLVTQQLIFFSGSILENVAYGITNLDRDKVIEALQIANAWEFVSKLPEGVDTVIGEKGMRLSGGQLQRLTIARAIIRNPRLLIMDEATSALDLYSERLIQEALKRIMVNRTSILVAHRMSLVKNCDRIVVIKDGEIVDIGSHNDLMKTENYYSGIFKTADIDLNQDLN